MPSYAYIGRMTTFFEATTDEEAVEKAQKLGPVGDLFEVRDVKIPIPTECVGLAENFGEPMHIKPANRGLCIRIEDGRLTH